MEEGSLKGFWSNKQSIRSLAEEATQYCINGHFNTAWTWEDKFVELIIRKCATLADESPYEDVGKYLLAHFGIESQD